MNFIFAETLRKLREEKGLTQKQLGKQMFVNHSTIARWESGSRLPDAAMIARLASALDVDIVGFLVKPLTPEGVRAQMKKLRYPFVSGGAYT